MPLKIWKPSAFKHLERTSVLISRTCFFRSLVKNHRINILIRYTVLLTAEESRCHFLTTWRHCLVRRQRVYIWFLYKKKKSFFQWKTLDEKISSFDSVFKLDNEEIEDKNLFWDFNILFPHSSPWEASSVLKSLYVWHTQVAKWLVHLYDFY